jgi:LuxR family transcriptional regulator, maltose regulon positive regulatory protein
MLAGRRPRRGTTTTLNRPEPAHRQSSTSVPVSNGRPGHDQAQAAAAERNGLLATKLHVPRPRPGFLPRPRLLERLAKTTTAELVLVCTPAGFGKTSLLADWARRSQEPVAWLSLDEADNDPTRFWRYVAAALDGAGTGLGERLAPLLGGPQPVAPEVVVTALVNTLAAHPDQVALVLDDYHLIDAPPVHQSLALLLERPPPQLRLVVASRADPPLPLARLRARGQLVELREGDLRFTLQETAALLGEATGLQLPAASLAALEARTEGWAAGLQLAGLSLRGQADPAGFVATFSGSHRYILDYLTEEVLARQPEPLVGFLLETSVLDRLSGDLCDAVTGRSDSQALLEQVERANLFLVPLDEVRGWWRYHQLFADLLRARLQQQQPERLAGLHRAAAGWLERHELVDEAIRHVLAAGDATWAARLVEQHAEAHLMRNELATVDRWLAGLPAELTRIRPQLGVTRAVRALIGGRVDEAEPLLAEVERAHAARAGRPRDTPAGAPSGHANIPAMLGLLRAEVARQRGDSDRTIALAQQAQAHIGHHDRFLRYLADWTVATTRFMQGQVAQAEPALAAIAADRWAGGDPYSALRAWYTLAQAQRAQGRLGAALHTCQQALVAACQPDQSPPPVAGLAHVGVAEVLRERNQLDAALDHATQGVRLCRQLGYAQWLTTSLTTLAWTRQARGDQAGALQAIQEAEGILPSGEAVVDLFFPVAVQRARLLLAHGEVAATGRWVAQRGLAADDEPSYAREREYLVLARLLLAQQLPDRGLRLLERLHDLAAGQGRVGSRIEVRVLQALALAGHGDEAAALAALAEALTLAGPEGHVRVFADEGAPMAALLGKLLSPGRLPDALAHNVPPDYLHRLTDALEPDRVSAAPPARRGAATVAPGLIEPLSERELEVLELLAAGRSNRQIADELVVALDTVKKHVSHILDKLGAANRTQAVTRARELALIP